MTVKNQLFDGGINWKTNDRHAKNMARAADAKFALFRDYITDTSVLHVGAVGGDAGRPDDDVPWLHGIIASRADQAVGVDVDAAGQNADVQQAAEQLDGIEFAEGRSSSILQGPLAVVTPVVGIMQTFTAVIGNTSGILQLLFGLPAVAADAIEVLFRIAMLVTLIYLIRSGSPV